jgi:hypothetical protein
VLILALVACGATAQRPAAQTEAGSAARRGSGSPPPAQDARGEASQDTPQEVKVSEYRRLATLELCSGCCDDGETTTETVELRFDGSRMIERRVP